MAGKPLVLVAAPQRAVRLLAAAALRPAGFRVALSQGSLPTPDELADLRPDVIVLEAQEPPSRTAANVRELASWTSTPVLLMSALATPTRVAPILDAGADDYIARPFSPDELVARIRALIRRRGPGLHVGSLLLGAAIVDLDHRTVTRGGRRRDLTRPEWAILTTLIRKRGAIVLREELLAAAFGHASHDDPALLRVAISRLRRKLGLDPWDEGPIRTVHGLGYAFDPHAEMPRTWSGRRQVAQRSAAASGHLIPPLRSESS
jgi:two-component system KDP operon response regulator KdpE